MSRRRQSKRVAIAASGAVQRKKGRQSSSAAARVSASNFSQPGDAHVASIAAANGFHALDEDCRLKILGFLELDDLAEASTVCRSFCDDCRHPSLPLIWERQLVLHVHGRASVFLRRLVELAVMGVFAIFPKVKVVEGAEMVGISSSHVARICGSTTVPEVTSLELSYESSIVPEECCHALRKVHSRDLWEGLASLFPNLRRLTVSSAHFAFWVPVDIARRCRWLESITWHGNTQSPFLEGGELHAARFLREIYMDDTTFAAPYTHGQSEFYDQSPGTPCLFYHLLRGDLELVSIKNARYHTEALLGATRAIPQDGLIKFVRRATKLKWFRSDLTPVNVAMLQRERPEVTFVS
jgi:hypothetical protein